MAFTRPTRMARAATKREHDCFAPPWGRAVFFVAAASSPPEGPSASRHADVHPTDALGARRYEEGARLLRATLGNASTLRSGGRQAVGKPARQHPSDRRAWRAPLRRGGRTPRASTKRMGETATTRCRGGRLGVRVPPHPDAAGRLNSRAAPMRWRGRVRRCRSLRWRRGRGPHMLRGRRRARLRCPR